MAAEGLNMRAFLTLFLLCAGSALAQEHWQPGERAELQHRERELARGDLEARRALCARIIDGLDQAERARFHALPLHEKERFLQERAGARSAKAVREFVDSLSAEERAALESLPEEQRGARVQELRVEREFTRALAAATERGLVSDARRVELTALDVPGKAAATFELMKATVLSVHGAEMAKLPALERERLVRLPASAFFRDPALLHLRVGHFVNPSGMQRLHEANPEERNQLFAALVDGQLDALGAPDLRAGALDEFRAMPRTERERLVEGLGRLLASGRPADGVPLSRLLQDLEKLPEQERQRFLAMPAGAALHALQEAHRREERGQMPPGAGPPDGRPQHPFGQPPRGAGPPPGAHPPGVQPPPGGGPPPARHPGGGRAPAPPARPRGGD